jgi:hypothetical protein
VTTTTDLNHDRLRRLANQRRFRQYFVKCPCERGCLICAYTGLVSTGHAKQTALPDKRRSNATGSRRGVPQHHGALSLCVKRTSHRLAIGLAAPTPFGFHATR